MPIIGLLPADPGVQDADRLGIAVYDYVPALRKAADEIKNELIAMKEADS